MSKTDIPMFFFLRGFGVKKKYLYIAAGPTNVVDRLSIVR
jgi:hypothetical protein